MIVAILACHDRRALTVSAVRSLLASAERAGQRVRVVLFDDGSSDGTADAVREIVPADALEVLQGDGDAFWARSMATAERRALETAGDDDLLLWLNDDVTLHDDALRTLLDVLDGSTSRIAVGATTDPVTGLMNYGGYVPDGPHPLRFRHLDLAPAPQAVDTFNGNCVLVPVPAARRIGGIEGGYSHGLADIDYGLRARAAGVSALLAPTPIGTCPSHPPAARKRLLVEWAAFRSVKGGGHPQSMRTVLKRLRPRTWPVFFAWSYCAWWMRALRARVVR